MSYEYQETCLTPNYCTTARRCFHEQQRLKRGEDLGTLHAPPCFLSLLRSLEEVETARLRLIQGGRE